MKTPLQMITTVNDIANENDKKVKNDIKAQNDRIIKNDIKTENHRKK